MPSPTSTLETRLRGTPTGRVLQDFLTNSAHFPLANMFLEILQSPGLTALLEPDLYVILAAAAFQSWIVGRREYAGRPMPLLGNLIAPAAYSAVEVALEGMKFFASPNHLAYWGFSLTIGLLQYAGRQDLGPRWKAGMLLLENLVRTSILLGMYWIFEGLSNPEYVSLLGFLSDDSHQFVALVIPLLGILLGVANLNAERNLLLLRQTAQHLRQYSEWLLGEGLLERAIADPQALSLQRRERAVLFMDIRGFTQWSEQQPPEAVVSLVNAYCESAEPAWKERPATKVKFTGDEIMAVFASVQDAARVAMDMARAVEPLLARHHLAVGIGVHAGPLIEGLIGSRTAKQVDVLGDTVNTGKRICDQAARGEILLSSQALELLGEGTQVGPGRAITAKGKREPLQVYPLLSLPESTVTHHIA